MTEKNVKEKFASQLSGFANTLGEHISHNGEWTIKGFIDIFKNVYTISSDTKIISKVLELHLFPQFVLFAESVGYKLELAAHQNYYPDITNRNNWLFLCQSFEKTIKEAPENAFVYCDPPYIGRHVDYYDSWEENSEIKLRDILSASGMNFMLSTWDYNEHRTNEYLSKLWGDCNKISHDHFYYVGAKESNRKPMVEALMINY